MSEAPEIILSAQDFFEEVVNEAFESRKLDTFPFVRSYIVGLLQKYVETDNLFEINTESGKRESGTLAEMYLNAMNEESSVIRQDLLKKLGDTSLYISGFFGDSLSRKPVDIDYYADIGGSAFSCLANEAKEDMYIKVYEEISYKFLSIVDVLTFISQKSMTQKNQDILRLYDRYLRTGSELAKEQLIENGVLNPASAQKATKQ